MRKWLLSLLFVPIVASAQKQYFLPTDDPTVDEKENPMIEVYAQAVPCGGCRGKAT